MVPPAPVTILVCDDGRSLRRLVFWFLTKHGYQVLEAQNGRHAMEVAQAYTGPIHLLLSDVQMPELDGPGLVERLRAVRPEVRVILMSAWGGWLGCEGCPFLPKPFAPGALLKAVGDSLAQPATSSRARVEMIK
jgi:two-component system, cell cycle sensor histidine kinase and response regulator CckA